ncbi:hypothetical protein FVB9288_00569 [Flavobacterium sp. CECT 9288]|uniref:DUF1800 domain-containing protein n=1 Tax=Flavobacterium sp. CECT 9288 TaxID=2845819 RepID=UPI001E56769A|nr:DUF1800 domain-containing protein [Flavobacterium sp. CECT 9288]CAH0334952.1 hypothetical protein FVB9288_00569 [Flavobacterium sp. CECT 9288]
MNTQTLWSLRLGFSSKQAEKLQNMGINSFLEASFATLHDHKVPDFMVDSPKSIAELQQYRKKLKEYSPEQIKELRKKEAQTALELKSWWIDKMQNETYPLREKMTCFWHNHFVSSLQKVKVNYWVFQHNQILRENAFGNFKTLTKKIIQSNAMVRYLDNVDNRKGKINENLSRELLELFTLGIGNYTETDIKGGAKGLAGLSLGEDQAVYRTFFEDDEAFNYLGKKGSFKIDAMIDLIFEQPQVPYLVTRKILKWFIYDIPNEELVTYYGDYFRKKNFEIKPLLLKIFTEEYPKKTAGSKIKNPLEYSLQIIHELGIKTTNTKMIALFCKQQGMDLMDQPNVKGWDGGNSWLTSQVYLQRNNVADLLCNGKNLNRNFNGEMKENKNANKIVNLQLKWNKTDTNKTIINAFENQLLFQIDDVMKADFEKILKYDFDGSIEGSQFAVLRLVNFMIKTPEFQLI